jgi:DNA-binding transcriptional MocR family regulator
MKTTQPPNPGRSVATVGRNHPPGISSEEVEHRGAEHGVAVDGGRRYFPAEPPAAQVRLSISSTADVPALARAVDALAQAFPSNPSGR